MGGLMETHLMSKRSTWFRSSSSLRKSSLRSPLKRNVGSLLG